MGLRFLEKATLNDDKPKNKTLLDAKGQEIGGGERLRFVEKARVLNHQTEIFA